LRLESNSSQVSLLVRGRVEVLTRLCMVVDWGLDHPEYITKIKVIPKKGLPYSDVVRVLR